MTPSIFASCVCGMGVLFDVMLGVNWCSLLYFVSSVVVDLEGATLSLLCVSHWESVLRYCCVCSAQMTGLLCEDVIVTSSAYEAMWMWGGGSGMSCMYRLKSVGDKTDPCGTPFVMLRVCDDLPLYCTYACLPVK